MRINKVFKWWKSWFKPNFKHYTFNVLIPVGGAWVSVCKRLDLHVVFGLTGQLEGKRADPQPHSISAPRLTVKVHRQRPGRSCPISNSLLDSLSRESCLQLPTLLWACRQSRIFTPEYIFSGTKTKSCLWGAEVAGPAPEKTSLYFFFLAAITLKADKCWQTLHVCSWELINTFTVGYVVIPSGCFL